MHHFLTIIFIQQFVLFINQSFKIVIIPIFTLKLKIKKQVMKKSINKNKLFFLIFIMSVIIS